MKKIIIYSILPLMSFTILSKSNSIIGSYHLNQVKLNDELIFDRNDFKYSLKRNYQLNKDYLKTNADSLHVYQTAEANYIKLNSVKLEFLSDSTFCFTKIRSGSKIFPNEKDFGVYKFKNDTILLTNTSRNNQKMMLILSENLNKLILKDSTSNIKIYQDFVKIN